ncbi:MAG: sigma-54 dependent transcriptional regulator [bacterium]|nr:sigma-54 dependent transcriptional regulator [bacterium]
MDNILIVEDKKSMRQMLCQTLRAAGYNVIEGKNGVEALERLRTHWVDLVLTDLQMPEMNGLELLGEIQAQGNQVDVIIMTAYGTIEAAVEAMKIGALDFITKPFDTDHLMIMIERSLQNRRMARENMILRETLSRKYGMPDIIGKSAAIQAVAEKIQKVAPTDSSVLLLGESGTGKELFARALHQLSDRRESNFVAINCAAIPSELLESELFGYEKGAFTGADRRKIGYFELAHNGSLFLDEIGELPLPLQGKLLRVIQEKSFQRLGSTKTITIDVRIISASNAKFEEAVEKGGFRQDLYYRLGVVPVHIPALRERAEDIPLLVSHLLQKYEKELNKKGLHVSDETLLALQALPWKGNVRELENAIERGAILCQGNEIVVDDMSVSGVPENGTGAPSFAMGEPLQKVAARAIAHAESDAIQAVLEATGWNKTRAAEQLKVSYKTLLTKIKDYHITKKNGA